MKDNIGIVVGFIMYALAIVIVILMCKWMFEAVMGSNMPDWLKYMILR